MIEIKQLKKFYKFFKETELALNDYNYYSFHEHTIEQLIDDITHLVKCDHVDCQE